jgi:hypothetical protein
MSDVSDILASIHTFPFIIVDIQAGIMVETWHTDFYTYSGVICLVPQTVLVLFSIGAIRDRYYETFKSYVPLHLRLNRFQSRSLDHNLAVQS